MSWACTFLLCVVANISHQRGSALDSGALSILQPIKNIKVFANRIAYGLLTKGCSISVSDVRHMRILIESGMGFGNAILLEPFLRKLRENFPLLKLGLEGPSSYKDVLKNTKLYDDFVIIEDNFSDSLPTRIKAWRQCGVDIIVEGYFPFLSFFQRLQIAMAVKNLWVSEVIVLPSYYRGLHETEEHLSMLQNKMGIEYCQSDLMPTLHLTTPEKRLGSKIIRNRCNNTENLVGLHLGCNLAHRRFKRWNPVNFASLCLKIKQFVPNVKFVLFGSKNELSECEAFFRAIPDVYDCTSVGDFRITGAVIGHCRLFISNDSGLMHLANAVGVPILAIFGPTIIGKSAPINSAGRVLPISLDLACQPCYWSFPGPSGCSHVNCLNELTPEIVWNKSEHFILKHLIL